MHSYCFVRSHPDFLVQRSVSLLCRPIQMLFTYHQPRQQALLRFASQASGVGNGRRVGKAPGSAALSPLWLGQKWPGVRVDPDPVGRSSFLWQVIFSMQCPPGSCRWDPLRPSLSSCPLTKASGKRGGRCW